MAGVLSGRINLPTRIPSALRLLAVASRRRYFEREKMFFKDNEPTFVNRHEYFGRLSWSVAAGRTGEMNFGAGAGKQYNTFYDNIRMQAYRSGRDERASCSASSLQSIIPRISIRRIFQQRGI